MTWQDLLNNSRARRHTTSKSELDGLRAVILRDLADAAIPQLSADRRFATAYNAALQACSMVIACAGYRITARVGHHQATLDAVVLAMPAVAPSYTAYFDTCRRKRNQVDYDVAGIISETEADELLEKVSGFYDEVERWIAANHPALVP